LIIKLILVLLLGWTGLSLIKRFKASNSNRSSQKGAGQKMVACVVCDTHVPESDVIIKDGKNYCSKEHAE
jgi:hypothetical protein|tara:strand:- start:1578 stop:1787 length:210 start_codon:yes stop_codon:yes gene_type:complete